MNMSIQDEELGRERNKLLLEYMPIIIFMTITGVVGVVGNIVTFFFYRRSPNTSTNVLIVGLAVVDLIVCCLSFTTVADLAVNVMYMDKFLCKLMYFSDQWMIFSSVVILWTISIDRYLKICRPLWKQFTVRKAYIAICISIAFALLASLRDLFTYDIVVVSFTTDDYVGNNITNTSFVGFYCTATDDVHLHSLVIGFHVFDVIAVSGVLLTFVFMYGNIVNKLLEHKRTMVAAGINIKADSSAGTVEQSVESQTQSTDVLRSQDTKNSCSSDVETAGDRSNTVQFIRQIDNESSIADTETSFSANSNTVYKKTFNKQKISSHRVNPIKQSERNVTIMMLAVTIGFFICFMPYFVVSVGIRITDPGKLELEAPIQFAVRSPFWNSVINPILFCVFNPRYRLFVKSLLKRD